VSYCIPGSVGPQSAALASQFRPAGQERAPKSATQHTLIVTCKLARQNDNTIIEMENRIYIKDWLELKPYEKQTLTDSYYLKICNDVKKAIDWHSAVLKGY